jgi:uroporphyrinogen-III synthase
LIVGALSGVGVLVTRPEPQALTLCRLFEAVGATTVRYPAIEIKPCGEPLELAHRTGPDTRFDLIVFTSANAVRFGHAILGGGLAAEGTLAAIGPATARSLEACGHRVTVVPEGGFDSESLLRHPRLAELAGKRVLIVKGLHGRELLAAELARRGAELTQWDVYRRDWAVHETTESDAVAARATRGELQFITATSADIAAGLLAGATPQLRSAFDRLHWLVPGARVAAALRDQGVHAPIVPARSADDHDLVEAVVRFQNGGSSA